MITIIGLGNPGDEYKETRHNIGRRMIAAFQKENGFPDFVPSGKYAALLSEGVLQNAPVRLILPETYMNKSGVTAKKLLPESSPSEMIVVYDELDLPIGTFKISYGRGSGGHNGIRSLIDALGTEDFVRVRIGIAPVSLFGVTHRPTGAKKGDFVLKNFTKGEERKFEKLIPDLSAALEAIILKGKETAMQVYNR